MVDTGTYWRIYAVEFSKLLRWRADWRVLKINIAHRNIHNKKGVRLKRTPFFVWAILWAGALIALPRR